MTKKVNNMFNVTTHVRWVPGYSSTTIRTVEVEGEPMFIAKDVAEALGYSNSRDAVSKHCKRQATVAIRDTSSNQHRNVSVIPESDVFRLVMRSKLPDAERFQDWVMEEVLPSIRKTGSYSTANDPTFAIPKTYAAALLEAARLAEEVEKQAEELAAAAPKVEFVDDYVLSEGQVTFREMAKMLTGANERNFRQFLCDNKIMYLQGKTWLPYEQHVRHARFELRTCKTPVGVVKSSAVFTPKGVQWIAELWNAYLDTAA